MKASKKALSWMLIATVFVSTAAACGDDDTSSAKTTVAADAGDTEGDTETTAAAGETVSANPDVAAFCKSAEELGEEFKKVMADPTSGDVTALTATATELSTSAATLASASPADATAISDCLTKMSTAMTGG